MTFWCYLGEVFALPNWKWRRLNPYANTLTFFLGKKNIFFRLITKKLTDINKSCRMIEQENNSKKSCRKRTISIYYTWSGSLVLLRSSFSEFGNSTRHQSVRTFVVILSFDCISCTKKEKIIFIHSYFLKSHNQFNNIKKTITNDKQDL